MPGIRFVRGASGFSTLVFLASLHLGPVREILNAITRVVFRCRPPLETGGSGISRGYSALASLVASCLHDLRQANVEACLPLPPPLLQNW